MKWVISTAIDSTKANTFLSRMHKSMGNSIINIEKERLYREGSSQEKELFVFLQSFCCVFFVLECKINRFL